MPCPSIIMHSRAAGCRWNYVDQSGVGPVSLLLLNLFLSMLASVQAAVIMMSQNRQDAKDRLRGELDYAVNRRAESRYRDSCAN
jgi:uncharacterized membrane protein